MEFDGRKFEMMIASDLERDGMWLEAWEGSCQVAGVFYSDVNGKFSLHALNEDLPLDLVDYLSSTARERLVPATEMVGENQ
jgi:hypothetical protein